MTEKKLPPKIETWFENLVGAALKIYGHPFTFVAAFVMVIFFIVQGAHDQDIPSDLLCHSVAAYLFG